MLLTDLLLEVIFQVVSVIIWAKLFPGEPNQTLGSRLIKLTL